MSQSLPQIGPVEAAIARLADHLTPVAREEVEPRDASGRVLANDLVLDRDSPAVDVSAMDGYAIRWTDFPSDQTEPRFAISNTAAAGSPPVSLQPGTAVRIFTGAPVPIGADCVIPREQTTEFGQEVVLGVKPQAGQHIRRCGENARQGERVFPAGACLSPARMAAVASFAPASIEVFRKVRVSVLNTGDELIDAGAAVEPWQIRDSNGPTLHSWLDALPWVSLVSRCKVADRLDAVKSAISDAVASADAVIVTGGVSMGDADFVPEAVGQLGGEIVFHRLPIRPGKPVMGACLGGKLVLGLPGNPVSVAVTARVIGRPLLQHVAGNRSRPAAVVVTLVNPDEKKLGLYWYRLVKINSNGLAELVAGRGSGDVVSLANSDGFVVMPPEQTGPGPWPFVAW